MRITNKMMSNNSLSNINTNKEYLDKLNNQMATEKKITRPSDDPIIAIRALRLRSNLSEITQYYGSNVPDAQAWVKVTESAINSTKDILSSLKSYADQGANGTNTASDREKIYENMNALKKQVYSNGNATYAGRSVFTGYRTSESLTFDRDTECYYRDIADSFNAADVVKASYAEGTVSMEDINSLGPGNTTGLVAASREQDVQEDVVNRIRLSYDDVDTDDTTTTLTYREKLVGIQSPTLSIPEGGKDKVTGVINEIKLTDVNGISITLKGAGDEDFVHELSPITLASGGTLEVHNDGTMSYFTPSGAPASPREVYNISADGRTITSYYLETDLDVTVTTSTDTSFTNADGEPSDIYGYMRLNAAGDSDLSDTEDQIFLVKDTGELIMGSKIAAQLSELPDLTNADTISVKYNKVRFEEGDVKPQHYFDCKGYENSEDYAADTGAVVYDSHRQAINYTVGMNQQIRINTNAEDVYDTQIMREIDDIMHAIENMNSAQTKVDKLTELSENTNGENEDVQNLLKAANKELELAKNKLQATFEDGISQFGRFFDQANLAQTGCGTVENRLDLISNRLSEEKTTVTTLASENENVDISNIAVEVSEANLVYNAALMATGRISQHTLVDYI